MKLFFDPIKRPENVKPLDLCVSMDMQVEEILHLFLSDKPMETAALDVINDFCSDPQTIVYRQDIVGDLIAHQDFFDMFRKLREDIFDMKLLYEMKMFKNVPEMKTMKTFLIAEKFSEIYSTLLENAEKLDLQSYHPSTKKIIDDICSEENRKDLDNLKNDIKGLRDKFSTIDEVRFNRYFSRGLNIENSIIPKTENPSLNAILTDISNRLNLDPSVGARPALQSPRELTRPVFISLYKLFYDVFKYIDEFHDRYENYFDTDWLELIPKLDAVLAFALIFKEIKERGFSVCRADISDSTKITEFYSLFLVKRGMTPDQVVCNDYYFNEKQPFYFITGPNAGGKTIFLSSACHCQLFFQACGFVPAKAAKIKLMKRMFTHFPVEEYNDNSGRLVEEQGRVDRIFQTMTDNESIAFFNETYSSTKADIAYDLSVQLCERVMEKGMAGLFVTHLHSLKDYAKETTERPRSIGVLTALNDEATGKRLYKIVPLSSQNSSYAIDILRKYDMTIDRMLERVKEKEVSDNASAV